MKLPLATALLLVLATSAQAQSSAPALLITPQQVAAISTDPNTVLLHVGPRPDYDRAHIKGAQFLELRDITVRDSAKNLNFEFPSDADLRARLERLGISDNSRVVVIFGEEWGSPATRVVLTMQAAGLGSRTQLMDGGMRAWVRAGLPVSTEATPAAKQGRLTYNIDRSLIVDHAWMQSRANAKGVRIIDARAPMFYDGPGMRNNGMDHAAGHLPGAMNIPFNSLFDDSMLMLPVDALREKFRAAGVQPGDTVAAYCHIGQQATAVIFAARLLGHPVRLYDGSMNDWENRKLPLVNDKAKAPNAPQNR